MEIIKLKCENCSTIFIADDTRHHMDICPKCKKSGVDLEKEYVRWFGKLKLVERFEPPWFDLEDDYHSALLSWLNDSDEEHILGKCQDNKLLIIIKI